LYPVSYCAHPRHHALPSFPTRRSSDLAGALQPGARADTPVEFIKPGRGQRAAMRATEHHRGDGRGAVQHGGIKPPIAELEEHGPDRKSTRLNSSHQIISYAVFCLKKKK